MNSINKKIIMLLLLCLSSTTAMAHIVLESNFFLRYIQDQGWTIYFETKTSSLSKKIQELNPELKGTNLNSTSFKHATFIYFEESIVIKSKQNKTYNLKGVNINFDGLLTKGSLTVENMPKEFEVLQIQMKYFTEIDQHITNRFYIAIEGEDYSITFNEKKTQVVFNMDTKVFDTIVRDDTHSKRTIYLAVTIILFILAIGIYFYRKQ